MDCGWQIRTPKSENRKKSENRSPKPLPPLPLNEPIDPKRRSPAASTPQRAAFQAGDAESEELKSLLDACVVGAHRLKLREQLRSGEACDCP